jgi:hypothetical protein
MIVWIRTSAVAWCRIHFSNLSNSPVITSVLKMMRPQNVIQSTTQTPVRLP